MTILAYIDVRPYIFVIGLPLFALTFVWISRRLRAHANVSTLLLLAFTLYTGAFTFFLTGYGPFVAQESTRTFEMTWEIKPRSKDSPEASEVILTFVEYPNHYVGIYSDDLAAYLRTKAAERVKVEFDVVTDYGEVRGHSVQRIGDLRHWFSTNGYSGTSDSQSRSPWD